LNFLFLFTSYNAFLAREGHLSEYAIQELASRYQNLVPQEFLWRYDCGLNSRNSVTNLEQRSIYPYLPLSMS